MYYTVDGFALGLCEGKKVLKRLFSVSMFLKWYCPGGLAASLYFLPEFVFNDDKHLGKHVHEC